MTYESDSNPTVATTTAKRSGRQSMGHRSLNDPARC